LNVLIESGYEEKRKASQSKYLKEKIQRNNCKKEEKKQEKKRIKNEGRKVTMNR